MMSDVEHQTSNINESISANNFTNSHKLCTLKIIPYMTGHGVHLASIWNILGSKRILTFAGNENENKNKNENENETWKRNMKMKDKNEN